MLLAPPAKYFAHPSEPDAIFSSLNIPEDILADLRSIIARRLTPKPVKVRADVEVKCFAYAGIEAIRKALQAGEDASTEEVKISVRLVAPPLYVMTTTSTDKAQAIEVMEKAVDVIGEVISKEGGDMTVKMKVSLGPEPSDRFPVSRWRCAMCHVHCALCSTIMCRTRWVRCCQSYCAGRVIPPPAPTDPSPKSSARPTTQSSRRSWSNSSRPTWTWRATTIRRRRTRVYRTARTECSMHHDLHGAELRRAVGRGIGSDRG